MKKLYILSILVLTCFSTQSQDRSNWSRSSSSNFQQSSMSVKGKLVDNETSENLSFATISIETTDSILISGGITDENGKFKIEISPMQMMKKIIIAIIIFHHDGRSRENSNGARRFQSQHG